MLGLPPLLEEADNQGLLLDPAEAAEAVAAGVEAEPAEATSADAVRVVTTLDEILSGAPATLTPARPQWIRHRVRPRERITQIAARYGVTAQDIIETNRLDPNERYAKGYWRVRIKARRIPPPWVKVHYLVQADENWGDVAAKFRVEQLDLRAWNWQRRSLREGKQLILWVDQGAPQTIRPGAGPPPPESFDIEEGAYSSGNPDHGRLIDGIQLPPSDLYTRREPAHGLWGSTHTIRVLHEAFANFRRDTGFEGEVVIGAISRRKGGKFSPHISHQSGRDVDVRLPLLPGVNTDNEPNPDEIDWRATWGLIRALIDTGSVGRIFLEVGLHRRLHEAARQMGETDEQLAQVLQWPTWSRKGDPIVRHSEGHDGHIHVRVRCGEDEPRCRSRRRE